MLDLVNNDSFTPKVGDICRSSGQSLGVVLANAGTDSPNQVPIGVWAQIASPGYVGKVATDKDGLLEVNCLEEPDIGSPIYLSATSGKGTKVYFTNGKFIGNALAKRYDGNWKATLEFKPEFVSGTLTPGQVELLGSGSKAAIAFKSKTYDNLADSQSLVVVENVGGTPTLVTFVLKKTTSSTGGVEIDVTGQSTLVGVLGVERDALNARPNAAYVWAINSTNDGLTGTAKLAGDVWNVAPQGTTLISGSVSTFGGDPIASGIMIDGPSAREYWAGMASKLSGIHPRRMYFSYCEFESDLPPANYTATNLVYDARGGVLNGTNSLVYSRNYTNFSGSDFGDVKWAIGFSGKLGTANTEASIYLNASAQDYIGVMMSRTYGVCLAYGTGYNPQGAWGPGLTQVVPASDLTGAGYHNLSLYSRGDRTYYVVFDDIIYGTFSVTQSAAWNLYGDLIALVKDPAGAGSHIWDSVWIAGDFRGRR